MLGLPVLDPPVVLRDGLAVPPIPPGARLAEGSAGVPVLLAVLPAPRSAGEGESVVLLQEVKEALGEA